MVYYYFIYYDIMMNMRVKSYYISSIVFCLKLKISITNKLIGFSTLGKLHIGPVMVLAYFSFRFKSWDDFKEFF